MFNIYKFLAYSEQEDGVYCLSSILFPTQPKNGSRAAKLITTPYTNWRKATNYLFSHADECEYHKTSHNKFDAFLNTQNNPSIRIDQRMTNSASETVERNRRFLKSILRALEYLGRQGLALRGCRDDGAALGDDAINKDNFKALLDVMSHTDDPLRNHLETCARNSTYISKTTQNALLECIKNYMQGKIVDEINQQQFGLVADEVTDSANWEQLGIVLRYVKDDRPIERLLEYVKCPNIRGATRVDLIIKALNEVGLNIKKCRVQTYDGAGNMAGKQQGAASQLKLKTGNENATYFHCASNELNLALSKSSKVPDIYNMICLLQALEKFFVNSPKREQELERCIKSNVEEKQFNIIKKKIKKDQTTL